MSGLEMKRNSVVALHLEGKTNIQIRRALPKMKLNAKFVHRTIKRFEATGSIKKRFGGGRRRTATTPAIVNKVRHRIDCANYASMEPDAETVKETEVIRNMVLRRFDDIESEWVRTNVAETFSNSGLALIREVREGELYSGSGSSVSGSENLNNDLAVPCDSTAGAHDVDKTSRSMIINVFKRLIHLKPAHQRLVRFKIPLLFEELIIENEEAWRKRETMEKVTIWLHDDIGKNNNRQNKVSPLPQNVEQSLGLIAKRCE